MEKSIEAIAAVIGMVAICVLCTPAGWIGMIILAMVLKK
jgi:hypothetical protein